MNRSVGNTKVICTIGPASHSVGRLKEMIAAGMDVARLNFSHGSRQDHLERIGNVRAAAEAMGESIAILQDLSGPKIRTGTVAGGAVELVDGQTFTFRTTEVVGDATQVSTSYTPLPSDVKFGDTILVDDGRMKFRVERSDATSVTCTVVNGGTLTDKKGMNLPGVAVSAPAMTEKDREDLAFGLANGIDYAALSFVRSADDIRGLREMMEKDFGRVVPIIAKIERPEAVQQFEEILKVSDVIMVARGDLGVELPPEEVPIIQKRIVRQCNHAGVPVIIATQMLESMIGQPRPTRAEANDVANAVMDGADAVMLSGETSVGRFPVETVATMDQIVRRAESEPGLPLRESIGPSPSIAIVPDAIARAAVVLADQVGARAIIAMTHTGGTALAVSRYRPTARILAVTDQEAVMRKLNLVWGVRGMLIPDFVKDSDAAFKRVTQELLRSGYVKAGDLIVFTAGLPFWTRGATNTITVERVSA